MISFHEETPRKPKLNHTASQKIGKILVDGKDGEMCGNIFVIFMSQNEAFTELTCDNENI